MVTRRTLIPFSILIYLLSAGGDASGAIPHLTGTGAATQLIVDGRPFVMLGGELHNSTASSLTSMEPIWDRLVELRLNTVLVTISWELLEPCEGQFDFTLLDGLIEGARAHDLKLVLLWFGSWKNGLSTYTPPWVKTDLQRFPRAQNAEGVNQRVLSPFCEASRQADAHAFAAMMRRIRQLDAGKNTVLMIQVENEIGMRFDSRDRSPAANAVFESAVPTRFMQYLIAHKDSLLPEIKSLWESSGFKESGTWIEVFGNSPWTDEAFMAWHMASYVGAVARAGKAEYPLPMYANAWLVQHAKQKPGEYPSGGPVSRVMDIWRAAAPEIDFIAPDIYLAEFKEVCASYVRSGNPLMIPEAQRGPAAARNVFWAIAEHDAICFAPFGIEDNGPDHPLVASYEVLHQLMPLIVECHGTDRMTGILQEGREEGTTVDLGDYKANVHFNRDVKDPSQMSYGLIINLQPGECLLAGGRFSVDFSADGPGPAQAEILQVWEGRYEKGEWIPNRCLNGDETAAHGRVRVSLSAGNPFKILRITLCRHD